MIGYGGIGGSIMGVTGRLTYGSMTATERGDIMGASGPGSIKIDIIVRGMINDLVTLSGKVES